MWELSCSVAPNLPPACIAGSPRVVLETVSKMSLPVRRAILMAGAIDDDCMTTEFKAAAAKIGAISVLASRRDAVLSVAFPLGNFIAGIIAAGHP